MSSTKQASQIVVEGFHDYLTSAKAAIESTTQGLELKITWAEPSKTSGKETPEELLVAMLTDVRVDDSDVKPNVNEGTEMPTLSKEVKAALAALALLIGSLAPPDEPKATIQVGENHAKLENVAKALHGMSTTKAKRASILETPLELLQLPPVEGNILAPFPNVPSPKELSLPALSSMVDSPTPSFALRAVRQSYCLSQDVAAYAIEQDGKMQKHGLSIPGSNMKAIARDEIMGVMSNLVIKNPVNTMCKLAKHLNVTDTVLDCLIPPEPTMAAIMSIQKTYKICKFAWEAGNLIRKKMIERGANTAASTFKMANAQHIDEIITRNGQELDEFVEASSKFKGDMEAMLRDVVTNARKVNEMIERFQGGDLEVTRKVKRKGMFGGVKDFIKGKKTVTDVYKRETRCLYITLPIALLHLDNPQ